QVAAHLRPTDVENLELDPRVLTRGFDETANVAPRRFQRLKARMVDDGVYLIVDQVVDRRDNAVDFQLDRGPRRQAVVHRRPALPCYRGGAGMLATMRSEVVSSSICSHGRICATALYEPGRPGISST